MLRKRADSLASSLCLEHHKPVLASDGRASPRALIKQVGQELPRTAKSLLSLLQVNLIAFYID